MTPEFFPMKAERAGLQGVLSAASRVFDEPSSLRLYSFDQGEVPAGLRQRLIPQTEPDVVVQPGSLEDLQAAVRYGLENDIPLVPRGASTFGMGGAVPHQGGILLDFSSKREIYDFDREAGTLKVSAGCRWPDANQYLETRGLEVCSYPTSWFSTIGGWASTGGVGIGCTAHGSFHSLIRELTVVLPSGEIGRVTASDPDFSFYLGTEGQMGAIWDVTFAVRKRAAARRPLLLLFDSPHDALDCAREILSGFTPYHLKFLSAARIHEINHLMREEHPGLARGKELPEKDALLACFEDGDQGQLDAFREWVKKAALMPVTDYRAHYLWRERMFPLRVKRVAPGLLASEVILPIAKVAEYSTRAQALGRKFHVDLAFEAYFVNDGTALVLPVYTFRSGHAIDEALKSSLAYVLTHLGIRLGGRPYGTGIWNTPFIRQRLQGRFEEYLRHKRMTDPAGRFNPGKFFEMSFRAGIAGKLAALPLKPSLIPLWAPFAAPVASLLTREVGGKRPGDLLLLNEELCSKCGSCIPVCPAYIETRDERTTARGKLHLAKFLHNGGNLSAEEANTLFLCMHCGACTDVCQSRLDLTPVWDELEKRVEARYGKDVARVGGFVESVEKKKIMEVPYARGAQVRAGHQPE
jgi:FAD/FMN-containing dehydrogenase/ferredoxin